LLNSEQTTAQDVPSVECTPPCFLKQKMKVDRGRYKCKENHFRGGALSERNGAALRSAIGLHADYPKGFGTLAAQWSE
jgi:hypothetical protein